MRILVKAKPNAKEDKVMPPSLKLWRTEGVEEVYRVFTKEKPIQGKANKAIARLLAEHFKVSRSAVQLVSGTTSRNKIFEINES